MNIHLLQLPRLIAERRSSAIFGVLIILMLWGGVFLKYTEDERNDQRDAQRTNDNYAMVFEENVLRSLREVDNTLLYLRRNVESQKDSIDYNTIMRTTDVFSDIIVQVAIIDAYGILRASSVGPQPTPPMDLSDRAHFRVHLDSREDRLYISQPVIGRVSGKWSVQLSRRYLNSDGTFGGVVVASLDPIYFTKFYDKVDLASSGLIALIGDDGVVRSAGGQTGDRVLGQNYRDTELFARMQHGANSAFEQIDRDTGDIRLVSLRRVKGQPLWVAVSIDEKELLAGSSLNRDMNCLAALLLTLITLGAMERIFRTEARAQQKSELLRLTLESMSQGIMLVTKDLNIPIINKRCGDLLHLPPDFIGSPPRFDQLTEYRNSHLPGIAVAAGPSDEAPADPATASNRQPISEWTMPDGTVLEVRLGELPDGGFVQTFSDITERARAEANIARLASEDALTGLLNRRGFRAALIDMQDESSAGRPAAPMEYAVLFLDLDRFKVINDTLGHRIGDLLLQETAGRLRSTLRSTDIMARLGGDEFAVIARHVKSNSVVEDLAKTLIEAIGEPFDLGGYRVRTSVSIGIAVGPKDGAQADDLVVAADLALYAAKEHTRGGYQFYQAAMSKELADRRQIELDLREAIERNELELYYQPIIALRDGAIAGFEALARWNHRTKGFVPPSVFIPVAEDTGLIVPLGEWALAEACSMVAQLPGDLSVAVNLSPVQFSSPNLVDAVQRALIASGLVPHRLELEITESLLLENNQHVLSILYRLKDLGVRIALDDFGTGYSALSYLRKFPLDRIKIDRSFISGLAAGSDQLAIVQAVISVARALGMAVTAEGIETADQRDYLKALGCDNGQGYLIGVPGSSEGLAEIVAGQRAKKVIAA
jgi:diguanylate cyclase (GGDEF)-like protein